ncbi:MAG: phosphosulfolactate synthase [Planctomycetota bacterium]|nr:phosphosulfolactate synthase [Planctomycetota bacterium]
MPPETSEHGFEFLRVNERAGKPRSVGLTEIRGPYYTVIGKRALSDVLDLMAPSIDSFKFSAGAFTLFPPEALRELIELCHAHDVEVSTGGFIERVLVQGPAAVDAYIRQCARVGFDILELSCGFVTIPTDDWLRLVEKVKNAGMKAKPEIGIQFGAGGASTEAALEAQGQRDAGRVIRQGKRLLEAGADILMIESEGITEDVAEWRTDVPALAVEELGLRNVMFEAADPAVFTWYVRNYGPEVNLFVDHSQIVQLECLRRGIWGTSDTFGRVLTYKG